MKSSWLRSPTYDAVWILSGVPIGGALLLLAVWAPALMEVCPPTSVMMGMARHCNPMLVLSSVIAIWAVAMLDMGHNLAPMCLAWTHREFRQIMLRRPMKFILLPLALLVAGTAAGIASLHWFPNWSPFINSALVTTEIVPPRASNPFWWLVLIYVAWNFYHFSKQNFGVLSIYRVRSGATFPNNQRTIDLIFGFSIQILISGVLLLEFFRSPAIMETFHLLILLFVGLIVALVCREAVIMGRFWTPRSLFMVSQTLPLLMPGLMTIASNGINHWLVAIGIAGHAHGNNHKRSPLWFISVVVAMGIALGVALFYKTGSGWSWNLRDLILLALPYTGFRLAMGFVHFLYDRWLYKLSDPRVRVTIGADIFLVPTKDVGVVSDGSLSWSRR